MNLLKKVGVGVGLIVALVVCIFCVAVCISSVGDHVVEWIDRDAVVEEEGITLAPGESVEFALSFEVEEPTIPEDATFEADDVVSSLLRCETNSSSFSVDLNGDIAFQQHGKDILRFKPSGVVYVHGRKTTRDIVAYRAFRGWLEEMIDMMKDGMGVEE